MDLFTKFPIIETERFTLRNLTHEDLDFLKEFYSEHEIKQNSLFIPRTHEELLDFIKFANNFDELNPAMFWAVSETGGNEIIGIIGFLEFYGSRAGIVFDFKDEYYKNGGALETLEEIVEYGVINMRLHRIECKLLTHNYISIEIIKRLSFKEEGLLRKYIYLPHLSKWEDIRIYSILREDVTIT